MEADSTWRYPNNPFESSDPMLRLAEEIMLLLLDDDGSELTRMPLWSMRMVFAGAVLMDLALENHIGTVSDLNAIFPVGPTPLQDDLLDPTLARIAETGIRDTRYWLERIAEDSDGIRQRAIARLGECGILRQRWYHLPWTFRLRRYPIIDGNAQREAKARIVRVLTGTDVPAARDVALICLADACGLFKKLLPAAELQRVSARLEQVRTMDLIGRTLSKAITEFDCRPSVRGGGGQHARRAVHDP